MIVSKSLSYIAVNQKMFFTDFFKSDLKTKIKYLKQPENQ